MMMPFDYKHQNPSGFAFLTLIRAIICYFYPNRNTKFKNEKKKKIYKKNWLNILVIFESF